VRDRLSCQISRPPVIRAASCKGTINIPSCKQPSEIRLLTPNVMRSTPRSLRFQRAQDHRNTTFPGREKTVKRASVETPSDWRVLQGKYRAVCEASQVSERERETICDGDVNGWGGRWNIISRPKTFSSLRVFRGDQQRGSVRFPLLWSASGRAALGWRQKKKGASCCPPAPMRRHRTTPA
jgi:hypothetical protein